MHRRCPSKRQYLTVPKSGGRDAQYLDVQLHSLQHFNEFKQMHAVNALKLFSLRTFEVVLHKCLLKQLFC